MGKYILNFINLVLEKQVLMQVVSCRILPFLASWLFVSLSSDLLITTWLLQLRTSYLHIHVPSTEKEEAMPLFFYQKTKHFNQETSIYISVGTVESHAHSQRQSDKGSEYQAFASLCKGEGLGMTKSQLVTVAATQQSVRRQNITHTKKLYLLS